MAQTNKTSSILRKIFSARSYLLTYKTHTHGTRLTQTHQCSDMHQHFLNSFVSCHSACVQQGHVRVCLCVCVCLDVPSPMVHPLPQQLNRRLSAVYLKSRHVQIVNKDHSLHVTHTQTHTHTTFVNFRLCVLLNGVLLKNHIWPVCMCPCVCAILPS